MESHFGTAAPPKGTVLVAAEHDKPPPAKSCSGRNSQSPIRVTKLVV
jgi:hypothetical protein